MSKCIIVRENTPDEDCSNPIKYSFVKDITKSVIDADSPYHVKFGHATRIKDIKPMSSERCNRIMKILEKTSSYKDFKIVSV